MSETVELNSYLFRTIYLNFSIALMGFITSTFLRNKIKIDCKQQKEQHIPGIVPTSYDEINISQLYRIFS